MSKKLSHPFFWASLPNLRIVVKEKLTFPTTTHCSNPRRVPIENTKCTGSCVQFVGCLENYNAAFTLFVSACSPFSIVSQAVSPRYLATAPYDEANGMLATTGLIMIDTHQWWKRHFLVMTEHTRPERLMPA